LCGNRSVLMETQIAKSVPETRMASTLQTTCFVVGAVLGA